MYYAFYRFLGELLNMSDNISSSNRDETFDGVIAANRGTEIAYFMHWNSLQSEVKRHIALFITNVRKNFHSFAEKTFVVVCDQNDDSLYRSHKNKMKTLKICQLDTMRLDITHDEVLFKEQIDQFSRNNVNAHLVVISGDGECCKDIFDNCNVNNDQTYWIHDLSNSQEDGALLQQPKETFNFHKFLKSRSDTATASNGQCSSIKAPGNNTPLVVLVDIENLIPKRYYGKISDIINAHVTGFDIKEILIAIANKNYKKLSEQEQHKLKNNEGSKLEVTGDHPSAADDWLMQEGKRVLQKDPNAHLLIVSSDIDFCEFIIDFRFYKNRDVYLLHRIKDKESRAYQCMIPSATQATFFRF